MKSNYISSENYFGGLILAKTISREKLFELVWSKPMRDLAAEFEISDRGLAKICDKAKVPYPSRGYWAKSQAGKPTIQDKLPSRDIGMDDEVTIGQFHWNDKSHLTNPTPPEPIFDETIDEVRARIEAKVYKLKLVKTLKKQHIRIANLVALDQKRMTKYLSSEWHSEWDLPYLTSPFEKRRLTIINTIFFALSELGYHVSAPSKDGRVLSADIGSRNIPFLIDDIKAKDDHRLFSPEPKKGSDTKMKLKIGAYYMYDTYKKTWQDTDKTKIEDHVEEFLIELILTAEIMFRDGKIAARERIIKQKKEAEEAEIKRILEEERIYNERMEKLKTLRIETLLFHSDMMAKANEIRQLVKNVGENLEKAKDKDFDFLEWSEWALKTANEIDPVASNKVFRIPTINDIP